MQRKQDRLIPVAEALAELDGPVPAIRDASPQARHHFTRFRSSGPVGDGQRSGPGERLHGAVAGAVLSAPPPGQCDSISCPISLRNPSLPAGIIVTGATPPVGRAGPDPVMRISTGVQGRTRHDLGGGRSRHCTPPLVPLWKWGCEMAQPQVHTRDMGHKKRELGRAYLHPRPFSHARAAPGVENRCPIFERACPGFSCQIKAHILRKNEPILISYRSLSSRIGITGQRGIMGRRGRYQIRRHVLYSVFIPDQVRIRTGSLY